jgi:hypothetical protein
MIPTRTHAWSLVFLLACGSAGPDEAGQRGEPASEAETALAQCEAICGMQQVEGCYVSRDRCVEESCKKPKVCPAREAFLACHAGIPFECHAGIATASTCAAELEAVYEAGCNQGLLLPPDGMDTGAVVHGPGSSGGGASAGNSSTP